MAFINPVTDDTVSWSPAGATKTRTDSSLVHIATADDTETTILTVTPPNNALYQFRATVLGRYGTRTYAADLRATYNQVSGTWTTIELPWAWNEFRTVFPETVAARFDRVGSAVLLKVTGEDGIDVDWSASVNVHVVSNTPLNANVGIDPATLNLTGYWLNYAGGTWTGTASAGSSGGRTLVPGTAPSVGANFGAHPSAAFNGTTQYLDSALDANDFLSSTAYTMEVVCDIAGLLASGAIYDEVLIFGGTSQIYISVSTSGVQAGHFNSVSGTWQTPRVALPALGTKLCIQVRFGAGTLGIRVNGGSWAENTGADSCDILSYRQLRAGVNYDSTKYFEGRIARLFCAATAFSDATLDGTYAHAQSNFGVP